MVIAKKNVLLDIVRSVGLDPVKAQKVIDNREFKDAVDHDWELSRGRGINAVPTFMLGLDKLVGAQPYEALEKLLIKYNVTAKQPL